MICWQHILKLKSAKQYEELWKKTQVTWNARVKSTVIAQIRTFTGSWTVGHYFTSKKPTPQINNVFISDFSLEIAVYNTQYIFHKTLKKSIFWQVKVWESN